MRSLCGYSLEFSRDEESVDMANHYKKEHDDYGLLAGGVA